MDTAWHMVMWDPPDIPQSNKLAKFIRSQQDKPENYPIEKDPIFDWKLRQNHVHAGFSSAMMINNIEKIVSLCTVTPRQLWYGNEVIPWAEIGDTFTDKEWVRKGMFGKLVNETRERAQEAGFNIIYGMPNEQSTPGYINKLNFRVKNNISLRNYTLILSSRTIAWWLKKRKNVSSWWFKIGLSFLENPRCDAIYRKLALMFLPNLIAGNVVIREEQFFGPEYDELWKRTRDSIPAAQVRDAKYLNWRFKKNPFPFRILAAVKENKLEGYIVTLMQDRTEDELSRMYIIDWFFPPGESHSIGRILLCSAVNLALTHNACLITALASQHSNVSLPWGQFRFAQRPYIKPLIIHGNSPGVELVESTTPLHFTLGDTDAF